MGPEDRLEVDIQPNLPSSNGYKPIITMMDGIFSFRLSLRIPYARQDCSNSRKLAHRRNDKTLLFTNSHTDR